MKTRALGSGCRHLPLLAMGETLNLASIAGPAYAQLAAEGTSTPHAMHVAEANLGSPNTNDSSHGTAFKELIVTTECRTGAAARVPANF